ncbi:HIT domain-containing protein [Eggerthellaceae bacterium zg-887]|uniref:histidine triad nucleotide-binding protein n=1 Tax=Xiamenia xianingshaonis TaxID=2682776 RepID=UPI00140D58EA|nr:histidine triad nucleotide-binding protein [Xiamenia xianingshaonis]NHM15829.1 HIT domain-containing protein [Xiamenia xianingshaonis]
MTDCLFCKLVSGEIPSAKVYEDDVCYAFDDIEPEAPVHTLIVPKQHYDNLADGVPAGVLGHLLSVVPQVAAAKGVAESGYRTVVNTGPDSAATVAHLHLHVLGGIKMGRFTFEESFRAQDGEEGE